MSDGRVIVSVFWWLDGVDSGVSGRARPGLLAESTHIHDIHTYTIYTYTHTHTDEELTLR